MPHEGSQIDGGAVARRNLWKMAVHCHAGSDRSYETARLQCGHAIVFIMIGPQSLG